MNNLNAKINEAIEILREYEPKEAEKIIDAMNPYDIQIKTSE